MGYKNKTLGHLSNAALVMSLGPKLKCPETMAISTGTTYLQFKTKVCNSASLSFVTVSKEQRAVVDGARRSLQAHIVLRDCFINLSCSKIFVSL